MQYRREVDGLRALAVIPVILFHAGFRWLSGGFVGVDIFFVISGYLITSILLAELVAGKFSVLRFYERRARRILPALVLVIAVCIPFSAAWLLPTDMKEFCESVAAVAVFSSNILFWRLSGYFDAGTDLRPLLHTWSLAVEEQFYMLFPLLLWCVWRLGKRRVAAVLVVASAASLAIAQWGAMNKPEASFYLLPSRAWELAAGALVAVYFSQSHRPSTNPLVNQLLSVLGLSLICYSLCFFSLETPTPSAITLVPVVGAALTLMYAWPSTYVGRLLGHKLLVGIGLISYSAYLWHHPIFSLARNRLLVKPSALLLSALCGLTFLLAYLSWRYVERPFRQREIIGRRTVFSFAGVATGAMLAVGLAGELSQGSLVPSAFASAGTAIEHQLRINRGLNMACEDAFNPSDECRTAPDPELILWGDSFAMHLAPGLLASNPKLKMVQATKSVCGPVLGVAPVNHKYTKTWAKHCIENNAKVIEYIKATKSLKYAVLSSPFTSYFEEGRTLLTEQGELVDSREQGLQRFQETLHTLRSFGITPIVFSPPPQDGRNLGRCVAKAMLFHEDASLCNFPIEATAAMHKGMQAFFAQVERDAEVVYLSKEVCPGATCMPAIADTILYRDAGHLTHAGSALIGQRMNFNQLIRTAQ